MMNKWSFLLTLTACLVFCFACTEDKNEQNEQIGEAVCNCMGAFCDGNKHITWTGCEYVEGHGHVTECTDEQVCVPFDGCLTKCTTDEDCASEKKVCATDINTCVEPDESNNPKEDAVENISNNIKNGKRSCK